MSRPLVLAIVGTDHHPFDRLVEWLDAWSRSSAGSDPDGDHDVRVLVQVGTSAAPSHAESVTSLGYDELQALIAEAAVVVTHGGPGTIMDVRRRGLLPIVVPRRQALGEHVDDHQVAFTERIASTGAILLAHDEAELHDLLDRAMSGALDLRLHAETDNGAAAIEQFDARLAELHQARGPRPGRRTQRATARSRAASDLPSVLFIAGWGRSGSTLLDLIAGEAPGVVSVGEIRELWYRGCLEDRLCGCGAAFSACEFWTAVGKAAFGGWDQFDAHRAATLRDRLDRAWMTPLLLAHGASRGRLVGGRLGRAIAEYEEVLRRLYHGIGAVSGSAVVVDSSKLATHGMLLRAAGVPVGAVHLVRDSRGVMHSWQKHVRRPDGSGDLMRRYGIAGGSVRYLVYNSLAQTLRGIMRYRRVRYEDLVRDPSTVLSAALELVGVDHRPAVADGGFVPLGTHHTVDGNPMRFSVGAVRLKLDDAWRTAMSRGQRMLVSTITAPLLLRYGYLRPRAGEVQPGEAVAVPEPRTNAAVPEQAADDVTVVRLRTGAPLTVAPDSADQTARCSCGSTWWTLRGPAHPTISDYGAVMIDESGNPISYFGEPRCLECGEPFSARHARNWSTAE